MAEYLTCPFCGFEFEKADTLCTHGCPMGPWCALIRCPSCQYEFPEKPQAVTWLGRLFGKQPRAEGDMPDALRSVKDLKSGESASVLCLGGGSTSRRSSLAVFGLVPGAELTVIQQQPACVVRIGETELALDTEIARGIMVQSPEKDPATP
jgi:Fe2+ transport system protein FeoA